MMLPDDVQVTLKRYPGARPGHLPNTLDVTLNDGQFILTQGFVMDDLTVEQAVEDAYQRLVSHRAAQHTPPTDEWFNEMMEPPRERDGSVMESRDAYNPSEPLPDFGLDTPFVPVGLIRKSATTPTPQATLDDATIERIAQRVVELLARRARQSFPTSMTGLGDPRTRLL